MAGEGRKNLAGRLEAKNLRLYLASRSMSHPELSIGREDLRSMSGKIPATRKLLGLTALFGGAAYYGAKKSALIDNSGNFGLTAVFEPSDLDFYRSSLPNALGMPDKPLVALFVMDFSILPIKGVRFKEAGVLLLCERDGKLGWAEVGVNVDNPFIYLQATTMMGSRKLFSNSVILTQENGGWSGEIRRFRKTAWSLAFIRKEMPQMGELEPWQESGLLGIELRPQITEPRYMVSKIRRKVNALDLAPLFPADSYVQTGIARVTVDPGQPWASLLKNGTEAPAIFIKSTYPRPRDLANMWREGPIGSRLNQIPSKIDSLHHKFYKPICAMVLGYPKVEADGFVKMEQPRITWRKGGKEWVEVP